MYDTSTQAKTFFTLKSEPRQKSEVKRSYFNQLAVPLGMRDTSGTSRPVALFLFTDFVNTKPTK